MDLHLLDQVAVITGGGTGIGKAAALEFAREGAVPCVIGRKERALAAACREAQGLGLKLYAFEADATDRASLERAARDIFARFGRVDIWVNNAGALLSKPLLETTREDYQAALDANLYSALLGAQVVAPYMKAQGWGVILNASSFAAKLPNAGSGVYAMAKSAVSCLTRVLAAELGPDGIRVVGYMPGPVATGMTAQISPREEAAQCASVALGRRGQAEEIGRLLAFLASDACEYLNGVDVEVSGGKFAVQCLRT